MGRVKPRKRYLLFHVEAETGRLEEQKIKGEVYESFKKLFGVTGLSKAGIRWVKFNPEQGFGIIRCSQEMVPQLRTSLAVIKNLENRKVRVCTVRVSGTLKTLRETLMKIKT